MSRARPAARPRWTATTLAALALTSAACDQPTGPTVPRSRVAPAVGVAAPEPVADPAPAPEPVQPRPILGRTTNDVKDAAVETKAGAVAKAPTITAKDPITLPGNAYVSIVGQNSILNIKHAVDLYQADTGEFPKTYAEFMEKIIQPNGIRLPSLPYYQEYGYDAPSHSLIILEYPDRKARANDPR